MKKRIFSIAFAVIALMLLLVLSVSAETGGTCGTGVSWSFNDATGELTVEGSGAMDDFANSTSAPWNDIKTQIKSITIENGVTKIGAYSFYGTSATSVFMADSVTEIGAYSFHSSKSLTSIDLSVNAETVGNYAFAGCSLLDNVVLPSKFSSSSTGVFQSCSSLKNLTIEEGVQYIGNDYFYGCSSLEEVTLPASLVKAGRTRSAFCGCTSLKKVIFLSATTEIPQADPKYFPTTAEIHGYVGSKAEAFAKVNGNTFVKLPEPDKYTGTCGDSLTWGLTESGLLTIRGEGAMADYAKEGSPLAPWIAYKDILIAVVIEDGVTTIGKYAFNGCGSLQTVVMSDSVTAIMDGAFRECKKLSSINLSKNLTKINQYAFTGAYALDNVVIPGTVTTTGTGAFQSCKGLKNITIENGVTVLANDFFLGCIALEEVKLPASLTKLGLARGVFSGCTALKKVSFLSATTVINGGAGVIPAGVEIHGYEGSTAKAYATENGNPFVELPEPLLDEGTCGANVKWELTAGGVLTISGTGDMDDYTKAGVENEKLAPWNKYASQIKEIVIADGVTNVGARAFASSAVTKVTMADSVTAIDGYAFNNCAKLTTITFSKNLSTIGEFAFLKCTSMTSFTFPDTVKSFGSNAFNGCTGLVELNLNAGLTSMYNADFAGCTKLTCVVLPRNLIRIGNTTGSFKGCTALETLVFLSHLTLIPDNAEAIPENTVIYCYPDSTAAAYAEKYDREVVFFTEFKNGGEMVFAFTAGEVAKPEEGYAPVVSLALMDVKGFPRTELLFIDKDGALFVKNGDAYAALLDGEGASLVLAEETELAIAYNDANGTARFYVNGSIPKRGDSLAIGIPVADEPFTGASLKAVWAVTADGLVETGSHVVDSTALNFAGFQVSVEDDSSIRILAGLDTLYYDSVGFEIALFANGVQQGKIEEVGRTVFSAVLAGGREVSAAELGFRYLTAITVHSIDRSAYPSDADVYFKVKTYVTVNGEKQYGDERVITIFYDGENKTHTYEKDADRVNMDGKKILVIGNSGVYYGGAVFKKDAASVTAQAARSFDEGYLYRLFKLNGYDVEITNWTHGGHKFSDMRETPCSINTCKGRTHLDHLLDREFDYVILSAGSGPESEASFMDDVAFYVDFFRQYNPAVKFVYLGNLLAHGHSSNEYVQHEVIASYKTLEDMGFIVADWGSMVMDIMFNGVEVPGATYEYTVNSFIVKDKYHPGPLAGYITSLFAYCAITGDSPVGQPYAFCYDASIRPEYDMDAYKASYYSASWPSNFLEIFKSDADMAGLQKLVEEYLTEKPYRDYEVPEAE